MIGDCSICLEDINNDKYETKCHHNYHKKCIESWLMTNNTCPLCRLTIEGKPNNNTDNTNTAASIQEVVIIINNINNNRIHPQTNRNQGNNQGNNQENNQEESNKKKVLIMFILFLLISVYSIISIFMLNNIVGYEIVNVFWFLIIYILVFATIVPSILHNKKNICEIFILVVIHITLIVLYIYYLPKGFSAYKNIDKNVIKINFTISSVLHISIELVLLAIVGIVPFMKAFM
jgi:hypothetical protein